LCVVITRQHQQKLQKLNAAFEAKNAEARSSKKVPLFHPGEFIKALGI
jgi:hypothetical protein